METKNSDLAARISKIRDVFCDGKNKEFARKLDMKVENASSYCNGHINAGLKPIEKILQTFPQVNARWLVIGEGEMFYPDPSTSSELIVANSSIDPQNNDKKDSLSNNLYDRFLSLLESQNKQIESRDRQIDRLITLLENKYSSHSQG